ncbi:PepSY-associated TM helix domain-containing protein [Phenylobacterium sp.]|uniref:PepSY-associated TM helix domain-containing protein n=1 Tax=Phenylobacterium sp. TaxID=1871053 RepID=UPI0011FDC629|nr:PepSY-associated TM helix domain-containing protein [Phenylobacterium sp.]THD63444.1 MAG: hypothetical protein E8A12_08755 [Phenylobacterium sp.]
MSLDRGSVFRLCRMLHAYLSAFAFIALFFFSATGILLNHPEWFENYQPVEKPVAFALSPAELAAAKASKDPGRALAERAAAKAPLAGAYASADMAGPQALVRLEGPKGSTDLTIDLTTGAATGKVSRANLLAIIQDLHRGKNSGVPWRFVIDVTAYVVLALSLIGYVLFFSLRFRLRTSLVLTGVSLLILTGIAVWLVP